MPNVPPDSAAFPFSVKRKRLSARTFQDIGSMDYGSEADAVIAVYPNLLRFSVRFDMILINQLMISFRRQCFPVGFTVCISISFPQTVIRLRLSWHFTVCQTIFSSQTVILLHRPALFTVCKSFSSPQTVIRFPFPDIFTVCQTVFSSQTVIILQFPDGSAVCKTFS